mmetsp:Transcript_50114/g.73185  ORF Transcript_50114/g.73185 Transcript_50114/m.73185 type:complete len:178 (+) Transcript_50114:104-637(+)
MSFGEVEVGTQAPPFTLPGREFQNFSLSSLNENHRVILAFFPAAFSTGAGRGADELLQMLNEHYDVLTTAGYKVAAISKELPFVMEAFRKKMGFQFPILSDASLEVSNSYVGSFNFGGFLDGIGLSQNLGEYITCNRALVMIDQNGDISFKWVATKDGAPHPGAPIEWRDIEASLEL